MTDLRDQPNECSQVAIERMRKLRQAKGLSAQKLADRMETQGSSVTRSIIANMENGLRAVMTVDELFAFAVALGTTPGGLLGTEPLCPSCHDNPPARFRCLDCGSEAR